MDMVDSRGLPIIIAMDSNSHSSLFGPDNNKRGDELEDFVLRHGLQVENYGTAPTFETRRGNINIATHIDVTMSRGLDQTIDDWTVDRSYNGSDHNTILFSVKHNDVQTRKIQPWNKADWTQFRSALTNIDYRVPDVMSMKKLDRLVDTLYKHLNKALDLACPRVECDDHVPSSLWANEKHDRAKRVVTDLYKKAKTSNNNQDWVSYRKADHDFKKMCKKDKNQAWRRFKESIQSEKDMAALAKLAHS